MYNTKNDLPEAKRAEAVKLLSSRLADCIDLRMQAKQAHWNVNGASFIALHELFDKVVLTITSGWLRRMHKAEKRA